MPTKLRSDGSSRRPAAHRTEPTASDYTPSTHPKPERLLRVAGLAAVSALFRHGPERVVRLFYEDRRVADVGEFCARMAELRRPYRCVGGDELARIAGTLQHGGVVAAAKPKAERLLSVSEMKRRANAGATWFVLDGIGNPHNLGAIARSLAFFGFNSLVLSDHPRQAGLSDAAYRTAEGGLDCLEIFRVKTFSYWLRLIKPEYQVIGTALNRQGAPIEKTLRDERPKVIILGNEETGLSPAILSVCDTLLTLPGSGKVQSLNVSATAAILAHAASCNAWPGSVMK
ncbi:MAG: TrmH family RNA methyltransferase [Methylococcus sp.]